MKIVILLSAGRHPVAGTAVVARLEAQAIRIAANLGDLIGLHCGPDIDAVKDALGQGLSMIEHIVVDQGSDPVAPLADRLAALAPDLVLAGRRSQGGDETGMVPYALAHHLRLPIFQDVIGLRRGHEVDSWSFEQSLGRGASRRVVVRGPAFVTIHPDAPPPLSYAYGRARRGLIEPLAPARRDTPEPAVSLEERPYRRRPKLVKGAAAGASAAERLRAVTGDAASASGGRLLVNPDPDEAAREILVYLRRVGVLAAARPVSNP